MSTPTSIIDQNLESTCKSTNDFIGLTPIDKFYESQSTISSSVVTDYSYFLIALADSRLQSVDCSPRSQSIVQIDTLENYKNLSESGAKQSENFHVSDDESDGNFYGSPHSSEDSFQINSDEDEHRRKKAKTRVESRTVNHDINNEDIEMESITNDNYLRN